MLRTISELFLPLGSVQITQSLLLNNERILKGTPTIASDLQITLAKHISKSFGVIWPLLVIRYHRKHAHLKAITVPNHLGEYRNGMKPMAPSMFPKRE